MTAKQARQITMSVRENDLIPSIDKKDVENYQGLISFIDEQIKKSANIGKSFLRICIPTYMIPTTDTDIFCVNFLQRYFSHNGYKVENEGKYSYSYMFNISW